MAKGGKRTYTRDGRGRFASTPGSAAKEAAKSTSGRASTLGARTGLKGSRAKLKAKDRADQTLQATLSTRAQKGAVKRGSRKLAAAKVAAQARISGGRKGVIGKPKEVKNREPAGRIGGPAEPVNSSTKKTLKRTGKKLKIAVKKAPKPTKEDRAIDKVRNLKVATEVGWLGGVGSMRFIPDKKMTPSRRKALGMKPFSDDAESQRFRVSRQTFGSIPGILISEKRSYLAGLPKKRQGVVRQKKQSVAVVQAAGKPPTTTIPKPPTRAKGSRASLPRTPGTVAKPKGLKPAVKLSKGKTRPGQIERATARALQNQLNSEDPRNKNPNARIYSERGNRPGKKQMRSMLRADSALDFYRDPAKALRTGGTNRAKSGYRVPRELSLNFDVWPKRRRKSQS